MAKKFVAVKDINELNIGDRIRHVSGSYQALVVLVVVANDNGRAIAIDTWEVRNPAEWEVMREVSE